MIVKLNVMALQIDKINAKTYKIIHALYFCGDTLT